MLRTPRTASPSLTFPALCMQQHPFPTSMPLFWRLLPPPSISRHTFASPCPSRPAPVTAARPRALPGLPSWRPLLRRHHLFTSHASSLHCPRVHSSRAPLHVSCPGTRPASAPAPGTARPVALELCLVRPRQREGRALLRRPTSDNAEFVRREWWLGDCIFLFFCGNSCDASVLQNICSPNHDCQVLRVLGISLGYL